MSGERADRSRRVLVIDDEEAILAMVGRFLRPRGWHVFCASSAEEGILIAARERLSVILLDYGLPRMNGIEAAVEFGRLSPTPVVMLTGADAASIEEEARGAGVIAVLRKPVRMAELEAKLESVIIA